MQNINRVLLTGNLTRDPELRETQSGIKVCSMRLAVNERYKKPDGEWDERPNYFDVTAFGATAENVSKYLTKGRPIAVDGRLHWREWKADDGSNRQAVQVIAAVVQFLDSGQRDGGGGEAQATTPVSAATPDADDDIPF